MANGAIGPIRGVAEDASVTTRERRSMATMERYYERVWNDKNVDAIDALVSQEFKIHRDGKILRGRQALKDHVTETMADFLNLRVHLEGIVAMGETVAIRLNVWHQTPQGKLRGEWVRFKGVDVSTVTDGQIIETAVSYGPSEVIQANDAEKLLKW